MFEEELLEFVFLQLSVTSRVATANTASQIGIILRVMSVMISRRLLHNIGKIEFPAGHVYAVDRGTAGI